MSPSPTTTTTTTVQPEYTWRNGAYRAVTTPKPPRSNFERWKPPGGRHRGYDAGACGGGGGCGEDWLSDTIPILCKILVSSPFDGAPQDCGGGGCAAGGCGKIHDRKTGIWRCQPHPDPMNPAGTKCRFNPNKGEKEQEKRRHIYCVCCVCYVCCVCCVCYVCCMLVYYC